MNTVAALAALRAALCRAVRAGAPAMAAAAFLLAAPTSAKADFDLKLTCTMKKPRGVLLMGDTIQLEINTVLGRVRMTDAFLAEHAGGWHIVNDAQVSEARIKFGYNMVVPTSVLHADMKESPFRNKVVFSGVLDRQSRKFRLGYRAGIQMKRNVRVTGTCR